MSRIRGRGNKDTELALAKLLRAAGISGWRRHVKIRGRAVLPRGPKPGGSSAALPIISGRPGGPSLPFA